MLVTGFLEHSRTAAELSGWWRNTEAESGVAEGGKRVAMPVPGFR